MKKIYLFLVCAGILFVSCEKKDYALDPPQSSRVQTKTPSDDGDISSEEALRVASLFNNRERKTRNATVPPVEEVIPVHGTDHSPAMYIINYVNNGGFVIVSATKKYQPVLAYSTHGSFHLADTLSGTGLWLEEQKAVIDYQKGEAPANPEIFKQMWTAYNETPAIETYASPSPILELTHRMEDEWRRAGYNCYPLNQATSLSTSLYNTFCSLAEANANKAYDYMKYSYILEKDLSTSTFVDTLTTTQWHQGEYYNGLIGTIGGKRPPAGCVAIALAQIMRYHQWPSSYNWSSMLDKDANQEVMRLIRDIGTAVDMKYGLDGSGSNIDKAVQALRSTYGYSATKIDHDAVRVSRELKARRPVYMRGDKKKFIFITYDGHAWVCDGLNEKKIYKEYYLQVVSPSSPLQYKQVGASSIGEGYTTAYYHMNWGWSDHTANGWYVDMNIYIPSQNVEFKHDRQDIINISPNK